MACARVVLVSTHIALLAAMVLLGCASDDPLARTYRGAGPVCVDTGAGGDGSAGGTDGAGGADGTDRDGGATVTFSVGFGEICLNPCTTSVESCRARADGHRITLTASLEVTGTTGAEECPAVCVPRSATCDLSLPAPGSYLIVLEGGRSVTTALPPAAPVALFGERDCTRQ